MFFVCFWCWFFVFFSISSSIWIEWTNSHLVDVPLPNSHFCLFVCLFVFLSIELVTYTERFSTWPFPSPFFIGRDFEWPSVKSN